ncbi:hypothetical protein WJX79_000500 [Trebouxia sp. C0005]
MAVVLRAIGWLLRSVRCGDHRLTCNSQAVKAQSKSIVLTSPAFTHGGGIPKVHAGYGVGKNLSPELAWENLPAGTVELAFVLEDIDVPLWRPIVHTVATGINPTLKGLSQGALQAPDKGAVNERPPQVTLQKGTLGLYGYRGPRPIPGHGPHTYVFQLFALKEPLTLKSPAGYTVFVNQLKGNVLAWGRLDGTYEQF